MLIVYTGQKSKREIQLEIHKLFEHPDFSMDVFVMKPEELEKQKTIANTLAYEVSKKGLLCYE